MVKSGGRKAGRSRTPQTGKIIDKRCSLVGRAFLGKVTGGADSGVEAIKNRRRIAYAAMVQVGEGFLGKESVCIKTIEKRG